jgi:hypothetical protein
VSDLVYYGSGTAGFGAAQAVVTSGAITAGIYRATVVTSLTGTVTAVDANNLSLQVNATQVGALTQTPVVNTAFANPAITIDVPASGTVTVSTAGTPSATAIYHAQIILSPIALYNNG